MKTYKLIFIIALALSLSMPARTVSAQTPSAAVSLTTPVPNPSVVGGDTTLNLAINVVNINPGVGGVEVYLGYNPTLVAPPTTPNGAAEVLPDFFGTSTVNINEVLPAAQCPGGASPCVHLVVAGPPQVTQNGTAARFHFRGLAEGSACFTVLQSVLVDANGFNVTHTPATQQCVTIQYRVTVTGTVQRQGVPANPNTGGGTRACSVVTATGTTTLGPVNTDVNGAFQLPNLQIGSYTVRAVYPGYLASDKTGITVVAGGATTVNLATTTLRGGDVNGDNAINILDIGSVISKFGLASAAVKSASANCTTADEPADINDDGRVNISDLAIAAGNWGLVGPTVWP